MKLINDFNKAKIKLMNNNYYNINEMHKQKIIIYIKL